jgi:DNA-binding transcriptional LysR family regulator
LRASSRLAAVRADLGIAFVPEDMVEGDIAGGRLLLLLAKCEIPEP